MPRFKRRIQYLDMGEKQRDGTEYRPSAGTCCRAAHGADPLADDTAARTDP